MKTLAITIGLLFTMTSIALGQSLTNQVDVQVSIEDDITVITWESTKEVNTSYFIIEKSTDDSSYTSIASVPASGSTHNKNSYSFEDLDTIQAGVSYRITMVCMDGTQYTTTSPSTEPMNIAQTEGQ